MPKNVMKLVKPSPHRARNDFDLSHRHVFSQNMGELIPSTCIETVPGDHFEISVANLMRAIPMVTSPFMRAKQHVDLWFVPYRDLWHNFDAFVTQKEQPVSSALKHASYLPHVSIERLYVTGTDSSKTDIMGITLDKSGGKLLNMLGYSDRTHGIINTAPAKVNLFRLAAYNYICYNEYRQQYYDDFTRNLHSSMNAAYLFNFDDLPCDTEGAADLANSPYYGDRFAGMCQMRYRCWKKDMMTGIMPATQFGNVSTVESGVANWSHPSNISSTSVVGEISNNLGRALFTDSGSSQSSYLISSTDILALRKSEAVQIWRENALRAGNRVADNMRAHYGVESDFRDHRPTYIGSVDAPLNIGDVMTTATSDYSGSTSPNTQVGDIAGKGTSTLRDNKFKFDAKDFGVIMAISSILPEAEYCAVGVDRMNSLLESEDFFVPEYEKLGLEAISTGNFVYMPTTVMRVAGYGPRYLGYKTKLDKCFGDFMTAGLFAPWCSPKSDVVSYMSVPGYNLPLNVLYVNPVLFNVNFSQALSVSDQFLNDTYFEVDAVRPMSVTGLPFS